jgi:uncharacterized protein (DUF1501 family)
MIRRDFIKAVPASLFLTGFPNLGFTKTNKDGRLIVINLEGGMDGLCAVPPLGDTALRAARRDLLINDNLSLNPFFGLHPSLKSFGEMLANDEATVIHATAFPYTKRSHFEGQNIVETGVVTPFSSKTGWLGRAMELAGVGGRSLSLDTPLLVRGDMAVEAYYPSNMRGSAVPNMEILEVLKSIYEGDALETTEVLQQQLAASRNAPRVRDPEGLASFAGKKMQEAHGPKVAVIRVNQFDTHANQGTEEGLQAEQLEVVDNVFAALKSGLGKMWNSTVVMTVTEFGRTLGQNGSAGTDHGYGSACMIAGGLLENAGIVSDWPGLKSNNLYEGRDLLATIDMRSVCAACLEATFGLEHDEITEDVFSDKAIKRIYNEIFT